MRAMTIDSTHLQSLELETRPMGWLVTISRICFGISILIVASLAMGLFFFAVPVWDDLIRATRPKDVGWWGYVYGFVYNHWQGRWASCGLESFVLPRVDISRYYWVLLGGIGVINITAAYLLCRRFTRNSNRLISLAVTAGLLALLWTGMPAVHDKTTGRIMSSVSETVYWFTGAVENAMVYALAIFVLLGITGLASEASIFKKVFVTSALCLAAIIVCGFHELYGLMFCIAMGLGTVASIMDRNRKAGVWIAVTAAAAIGLLVVILAPGNTARFASDGGSHARHFRYDLVVALSQVLHYAGHWVIDPKLLGLSAWMLTTPVLMQPPTTSRFPWRWAVLLAWSIMLAAGFFAPSWAFGNWMPPRTIAGVYIIFVL
jgi:hypothetical protein